MERNDLIKYVIQYSKPGDAALMLTVIDEYVNTLQKTVVRPDTDLTVESKYTEIEVPGKGNVIVNKNAPLPVNKATYVYNSYSQSVNQYYATSEIKPDGIFEIVASEFQIYKSIALYKRKDDVEKLALNHYPDRTTPGWNDHWSKSDRTAFIEGYKAAASKGMFTEDDIWKAFIAGANWERNMPNEKDIATYMKFIKDKSIEFVTEEVRCSLYGCGNSECLGGCISTKQIIQTTTDKDGWKWYTLKS